MCWWLMKPAYLPDASLVNGKTNDIPQVTSSPKPEELNQLTRLNTNLIKQVIKEREGIFLVSDI